MTRTLTCPSGATPSAPGGGYENCSFYVRADPTISNYAFNVSPSLVTVAAGDSADVNFSLAVYGPAPPPIREDFDLIAFQRNTRSGRAERVNLNAKLYVVRDQNRHLCG
ncbi:MAG: hypothetical protein ACE37F_03200 [Nannocystaceae bacterium]|nr:hypothetical protein [bacterium]